MTPKTFALVDGNSFYASCQIAFDPSIKHRPVVVLSNNDGCIVAANQIAKNLNDELIQASQHLGNGGYQAASPDNMMFQPYFKVKWILDTYQAVIFSSNYELYADMSNRMHAITGSFAVAQEVYSIDESFLDLTGLNTHYNLTEYGHQIRQRVQQDIGIPVAVGIGPSKTLAKLANHLAKKIHKTQGVLDWNRLTLAQRQTLMTKTSVDKIWGVGKRISSRLKQQGIHSVWDLKNADPTHIRKTFNVVLERTVRELNGYACLELEQIITPKKQIMASRSFGQPMTEIEPIAQAISSHIARGCEKLRQQHSVCQFLTVFIRTNPFQTQIPQYRQSKTIPLIQPSHNTFWLCKLGKQLLSEIFQPGFHYHKAGIMLSELSPEHQVQTNLFSNENQPTHLKQQRLMPVIDQINQQYGKHCLYLANRGTQKSVWAMQRNAMSSRYTTRWQELLSVH